VYLGSKIKGKDDDNLETDIDEHRWCFKNVFFLY